MHATRPANRLCGRSATRRSIGSIFRRVAFFAGNRRAVTVECGNCQLQSVASVCVNAAASSPQCALGFTLFDLETEELTFLCHPEPEVATNRLNDGKVSPEGRFWAGTMDERPEKKAIGNLYRLDADHRCTRMAGGVKVSNGLAWSPDGVRMDSRCTTRISGARRFSVM